MLSQAAIKAAYANDAVSLQAGSVRNSSPQVTSFDQFPDDIPKGECCHHNELFRPSFCTVFARITFFFLVFCFRYFWSLFVWFVESCSRIGSF